MESENIIAIALAAAYIFIAILLLVSFRRTHKIAAIFAVPAFALIEAPLIISADIPLPPTKYALPVLLLIVPHILITLLLMFIIKKKEKLTGLFIALASIWGVIGLLAGVLYYFIGPDPTGPFTKAPQFDKAEIVIAESSDISKEDVEDAIEVIKDFVSNKDSYSYTIFKKFEYKADKYSYFTEGQKEIIIIYSDFDVSRYKGLDTAFNEHMTNWKFEAKRDSEDSEWEIFNYGYG